MAEAEASVFFVERAGMLASLIDILVYEAICDEIN
jgi:hypothetical protein